MIWAADSISAVLYSPFRRWGRLWSAMRSARRIFPANTLSSSMNTRLKVRMNTTIPRAFMVIMGNAISRTRSRAAWKGREMRRMIAIWATSAAAVMRKMPVPSRRPCLKRLENAEPISPSTKVDTAQLTAVKPPMSKR